MERYTIEQRVFIIKEYFKNSESLAAAVRKFHTKYGRNSVLTSSTVKRLIEKFMETGSVGDAKHTGRPKTSRSNVNIEAVRESVADNPGTSIRRRGQELQISRTSLQRILTKDLCLHAYKIAEYVPVEKRPKGLFRGRSSNKSLYSTKVRREKQRIANLKVDKNTHMKRTSARLSKINNKLEILKKVGIDYDFKPTDVPEKIGKKSRKGNQSSKAKGVERKIKVKSEKVMYTFQQDPNDSEIEIKVPLILKPRTKRTTRKVPSTVVTKKTAKKAPQTKKTLQQKLVKRKNVKK